MRLKQLLCFHDWGAPDVRPMYLARTCTKCGKVVEGKPILRGAMRRYAA